MVTDESEYRSGNWFVPYLNAQVPNPAQGQPLPDNNTTFSSNFQGLQQAIFCGSDADDIVNPWVSDTRVELTQTLVHAVCTDFCADFVIFLAKHYFWIL